MEILATGTWGSQFVVTFDLSSKWNGWAIGQSASRVPTVAPDEPAGTLAPTQCGSKGTGLFFARPG
jgi:hypothetical protein